MLSKIFQAIPCVKGKLAVCTKVLKAFGSLNKPCVVKGKYGIEYSIPNLSENISSELFINGIYEKESIEFICERLPKNAFFLDIGANIGAISLPIAHLRPDVTIACIEASSELFAYLQKNITTNKLDRRVIPINMAVHQHSDLELEFYSRLDVHGKGSFSSVFTKEHTLVHTINVLDVLRKLQWGKVDFIKIDIEGYEYLALKGAEGILGGENAPQILFEFVDWAENQAENIKAGDAQQYLLDQGYTIYRFENHRLEKLPHVLRQGAAMLFAKMEKQ